MARILVIEDDILHAHLIEDALCEGGHAVIHARNGKEGLMVAGAMRPDVVVLDINLPDIDGVDMLGRLFALDRQRPIVVHTAHARFEENFRCYIAEAVVLKSSNFEGLRSAVDRSLLGPALARSELANN